MELRVRNVQEAYVLGLALLRGHGQWEDTRNGRALVLPEPMVTIYERPIERVLLDPTRDANPFFHLMEAIWMLAGRNDVDSLLPFNKALAQYSDDGETYHGAYGHRWRRHFTNWGNMDPENMHDLDQVRRVIELLRANPSDRRCVIQMWDAEVDLGRDGKDFPCNDLLMFRTRLAPLGQGPESERNPLVWTLDMTICCRSNDAVWGAYGANAVHFSVLQEFIAAAAGMGVGRMIQVSNNFHAYEAVLEKVGEPCWPVMETDNHRRYEYSRSVPLAERIVSQSDAYKSRDVFATPLFRTDATTDLDDVFKVIDGFWDDTLDGAEHEMTVRVGQFTSDGIMLLSDVRNAYLCRREAPEAARQHINDLPERSDWRRACLEWLGRRAKA